MVRLIAVVGGGTMGHGIAFAAISGGYETALVDVSAAALDHARAAIEAISQRRVARGELGPDDAETMLARLRTSTDLDPTVREDDLIVEAIPERMDAKLRLMAELDHLIRPGAVIASNTSALSITEMAAATSHPGQVAGMHFFNPVPKMRLVEIVRALESTPETLQTIEAVAHAMGKETVVVRESPGFVTSRINALIGNEAFYMLQEGIAAARDIDRALRLGLNHPMGPFELVDLVGLDTRLSVLEFLHSRLGEKYRPCPLLVEHVREGRLGRKVGRGVYEYEG